MIPCRVMIGIHFFMACVVVYMLRVNLSVNIVAMVVQRPKPPTATECTNINGTSALNINYGPRYEWNNEVQGIILGAYYWGYIPFCLIAGYLAERFSPTNVVAVSTFAAALLTAISPLAASMHYYVLIFVRILLGATGGVVYPCLHSMLAKWVPPKEKGRFIGSLMGGTFGTVLTWSCVGYIIDIFGWVWAFYIPAIFTGLWGILWCFCVYDTPSEHKRISIDERDFITKATSESISNKKMSAPYGVIVKSIPFWSLVILHVGNCWGLYFILTVGPKFLSEILGFNLKDSGVLSSMPSMARLLSGFLFGYVTDKLREKEIVGLTFIRKFFCIFSHLIPGMLLMGMLLIGCDYNMAVVLLTLSQGFNGASTVTNLQNAQDLAPNFAGSLYGTMNAFGSVSGILSPYITGQVTKHNNDMTSWHVCFVIGAMVYFLSTIVFFIFGTTERQVWNDPSLLEDKKTKNDTDLKGAVNDGFTPC